jgi:hypothetical protein
MTEEVKGVQTPDASRKRRFQSTNEPSRRSQH